MRHKCGANKHSMQFDSGRREEERHPDVSNQVPIPCQPDSRPLHSDPKDHQAAFRLDADRKPQFSNGRRNIFFPAESTPNERNATLYKGKLINRRGEGKKTVLRNNGKECRRFSRQLFLKQRTRALKKKHYVRLSRPEKTMCIYTFAFERAEREKQKKNSRGKRKAGAEEMVRRGLVTTSPREAVRTRSISAQRADRRVLPCVRAFVFPNL